MHVLIDIVGKDFRKKNAIRYKIVVVKLHGLFLFSIEFLPA